MAYHTVTCLPTRFSPGVDIKLWARQTDLGSVPSKKRLLLPHECLSKDDREASPPQKCHVLSPHWDISWVSVTYAPSLNILFMSAHLHNSG